MKEKKLKRVPKEQVVTLTALVEEGRFAEANALCAELTLLHPMNPHLLALKAQLLAAEGAYEEILHLTEPYTQRASASHNLLFWRSFALFNLQRWREALQLLNRLARYPRTSPQALWLRAGLLRNLNGDTDASVLRAYNRLLKRDPTNLYARVERADVLRSLGRSKEAIAAYKDVLLATSEASLFCETAFKLGCVLMAEGENEKALEQFLAVLDKDPTYPDAQFLHDMLASEMGLD